MKHLLIFLILASLLAASCQKEASSELPENVNPDSTDTIDRTDSAASETADGNRLARSVFYYAPDDSTYTDYVYDTAGVWMGHQMIGDGPVYSSATELILFRSADGIITGFSRRRIGSNEQEILDDYHLHYDINTKQYQSRVAHINLDGVEATDSTIILYDAKGRISEMRLFLQVDLQDPFIETNRVEFSYDVLGNLSLFRSFSAIPDQSGKFEKTSELAFEFDNKTNPLILGSEAILCDELFYVSPNNILTITSTDFAANSPAETILNFTYNYHASGRPKSGTMTSDGDEAEVYLRYK